MRWTSPVFNNILWTNTALSSSVAAGERDLLVIIAGFQVERAACDMLGTQVRQG